MLQWESFVSWSFELGIRNLDIAPVAGNFGCQSWIADACRTLDALCMSKAENVCGTEDGNHHEHSRDFRWMAFAMHESIRKYQLMG